MFVINKIIKILCILIKNLFLLIDFVKHAFFSYQIIGICTDNTSVIKRSLSNSLHDSSIQHSKNDLYSIVRLKFIVNFIFFVVFIAIFASSFTYVIDYYKTVGNILNASDVSNRLLTFWLIIFYLLVLYLFIKSTNEYILHIVYRLFKIETKLTSIWTYTYFLSSVVVVCSIIFSELVISSEINKRSSDFNLLSSIESGLNKDNVNFNLYVDKEPLLYRRASIEVNTKILTFDDLALKNQPNLIVARPNDLHIFLLAHEYKFVKLSDTMSLYVKDENIISSLKNNNNIVLSNNYTFKKDLNLKRIAKVNGLKFRDEKGLRLKSPWHSIRWPEPEFWERGSYIVSIHADKYGEFTADNNLNDQILANVKIISNNGSFTLYDNVISYSDFKGKSLDYSFKTKLDSNYHSVRLLVNLCKDEEIYVTKITIKKID